MEHKFLTSETKKLALIASVAMLILSVINIFLIVFYTPTNVNSVEAILAIFPFITTLILLAVSMIAYGITLIKVFADYKKQTRMLCANGIIYISIVILSALIVGFVVGTMASKSLASVYVYAIIIGCFAVWNVFVALYGFKNKFKNAFFSIVYALIYVAYAVIVTLLFNAILVGGSNTIIFITILSILSVTLAVTFAIDLLLTFVLKEPTFLETEEGARLLNEAKLKKQEKEARLQARLDAYRGISEPVVPVSQPVLTGEGIEEKIKKLDSLLAKNLITEEEYKTKKQKLIDEL